MATPGSSFTPTPLGYEDNLEVRHHPWALQWHPSLFNFPHPEVGSTAGSSPWVRDWYEIFGSALAQNTDTDFAQLKAALAKTFPVVRNRNYLESQFYASRQNRDQDPTDFIYDQLKVHKKLGLSMPEEALVNHIFVRLEPQFQDYRNSKKDVRVRKCKVQGIVDDEVGKDVGGLIMTIDRGIGEIWKFYIDGRNNYRGNYESGRQRNQWFESRNGLNRDDQRFDRGYQSVD
ncbi:uncharacterized protein TNCV_2715291 [Trichonephila clavipes]|nr:uncharacterized protein TNCV_2715291 [Trichonephila clavipes]